MNSTELAQQTGINQATLDGALSAVCDMIVRDGLALDYIEGSAEFRTETCQAYLAEWLKKSEQMHTLYLTNAHFRDFLMYQVMEMNGC